MFSERTYKVLEAAVQEYINEGKPVSSKDLAKKYKFGIKDASVRAELNHLTENGFLNQPHISGGRVPTDKGYQFMVDLIFKNLLQTTDINSTGRHINQLIHILMGRQWTDFFDEFSQEMGLLGAGYEINSPIIYKSGLDELFENLELETKEEFYEIARDFENLDEKLKLIPQILKNSREPKIFIGKKSPLTRSEHLSVIIDGLNIGSEQFYIAAIGPKRMDYQKKLRILKQIKDSTRGFTQTSSRTKLAAGQAKRACQPARFAARQTNRDKRGK